MEPLGVTDPRSKPPGTTIAMTGAKILDTTKDLAPGSMRFGGLFAATTNGAKASARWVSAPRRETILGGRTTNRVGTHGLSISAGASGGAPSIAQFFERCENGSSPQRRQSQPRCPELPTGSPMPRSPITRKRKQNGPPNLSTEGSGNSATRPPTEPPARLLARSIHRRTLDFAKACTSAMLPQAHRLAIVAPIMFSGQPKLLKRGRPDRYGRRMH